MNYLALQDEVITQRYDESLRTQIKAALANAQQQLWAAADWRFKYVSGVNLAVVLNVETVVLPSDYGDELQVLDDLGDAIEPLDSMTFERLYRADKRNNVRGRPEAFKVVNGVMTLAPTPGANYTFTHDYRRRVSHFSSDGVTVVGGEMVNDTDLPFWATGHHMVIVHKALQLMGGARSDVSAAMWAALADEGIVAMMTELVGGEAPIPESYGAIDW